MVQNSFISLILQEEKEENRGSVEFQVFSWTNKIRRLTSHLELHRKDYSSQRLLSYLSKKKRVLICQRKHQRLLSYLSKKKRVLYKYLINQLGIRESKTR